MFLTSIRADSVTQDRSVFGDFWFAPLSFIKGAPRVTHATALGLPIVYACIKVIAESFAVMPFNLFLPTDKGRKKVTNHWLYRLFRKRPNAFQTPFEWRLMLMGHLALRGNAFCQITANDRGEIIELLPLHPDRMKIETLPNGSYRYVYRDQNGQDIYYSRQEIWHLRGYSDDGYMGLSPIALAREAVGEGLAIQQYSNRFFANDARPGGGWIETAPNFKFQDERTKQAFRESWQQMQGGVNRGKVAVLEHSMKYHDLAVNNTEAQFIETRQDKRKEIPAIWRVPPHKVGVMDAATFSNIEQQSIEFWTDCMWPWCELWESSIEFFLLGPDEPTGLEPEFDMSRMMRGDQTARGNWYKNGIFSGWMVRNEAREAEGYEPLDGLDEPLTPLNMVEESEANDGPPSGNQPGQQQPQKKQGARELRRHAMVSATVASFLERQDRFEALVRGNAERMARRLAGGNPVTPDTLAGAMAVSVDRAKAWLEADHSGRTEQELLTSLIVNLAD